ncbi:hypothetical protein L596_019242 [Steinernema carpocapsae]|uniref:Uncharacterized protein n=1 Tax=Steinernema carpocapsae TaxID=34508 RepID=A0A4V6A0I4_STECR|nr:hypothetical protein L596_019242 [Steinernema carpocapsae]
MRIPEGAPLTSSMKMQQKLGVFRRFKKPSLGTVAVVATVALTAGAVFAVTAYPKLNNDYYKEVQKQKRAMIEASRDELAHGQRPWSDPFDRK